MFINQEEIMSKIEQIKLENLTDVFPLFQEYRKFYRKEASPTAEQFLTDRLKNNESVIYAAYVDNRCVGFVQLFTTFSSLNLGKIVILNDLYILPDFRRKKIATELINVSIEHAKSVKATGVSLSTQIANTGAQDLHKKIGFKKDNDFFYFNFLL